MKAYILAILLLITSLQNDVFSISMPQISADTTKSKNIIVNYFKHQSIGISLTGLVLGKLYVTYSFKPTLHSNWRFGLFGSYGIFNYVYHNGILPYPMYVKGKRSNRIGLQCYYGLDKPYIVWPQNGLYARLEYKKINTPQYFDSYYSGDESKVYSKLVSSIVKKVGLQVGYWRDINLNSNFPKLRLEVGTGIAYKVYRKYQYAETLYHGTQSEVVYFDKPSKLIDSKKFIPTLNFGIILKVGE